MPVHDETAVVRTRAELAAFVAKLASDLKRNPDDWENVRLDAFLEAMAAWIEDTAERDLPPQDPTWQTFAQLLIAGARYE